MRPKIFPLSTNSRPGTMEEIETWAQLTIVGKVLKQKGERLHSGNHGSIKSVTKSDRSRNSGRSLRQSSIGTYGVRYLFDTRAFLTGGKATNSTSRRGSSPSFEGQSNLKS